MPTSPIQTIDAHQFGSSQRGAVYVVRDEHAAFIESGTAASANIVLRRLHDVCADRACSPRYIFLTHIHLDHAGGAGHLVRAFPEAKVVVHERGVRHLVDPRQLIEGVRLATGRLFPLYGSPLPIPQERLIAVTGGEVFELGANIRLEVVASPGHAPHHVCYYERATRTLFAGDAVGNWHNPVDIPLTVPPRFDLTAAKKTLRTLSGLSPENLAFTHFGISPQAIARIQQYETQLVEWFGRIRHLTQTYGSAHVMDQILSQPQYAAYSQIDRQAMEMCVRGAMLSLEAGTA